MRVPFAFHRPLSAGEWRRWVADLGMGADIGERDLDSRTKTQESRSQHQITVSNLPKEKGVNMITRTIDMISLVAVVGAVSAGPLVAQNPARSHVGHVADGFRGTPDGMGLLPAAQAEAEVAAQHAGLAAKGDLAGMKGHIAHVMHALDPESAEGGPGKGYGLINAAQGAARHIQLAADAEGASDNVKLHAQHVAASASNVAEWGMVVMERCREIQKTDDEAKAKEMVAEIQLLLGKILSGHDENDDGRVSWDPSERGLEQAAFHLNLLKSGEGMDG